MRLPIHLLHLWQPQLYLEIVIALYMKKILIGICREANNGTKKYTIMILLQIASNALLQIMNLKILDLWQITKVGGSLLNKFAKSTRSRVSQLSSRGTIQRKIFHMQTKPNYHRNVCAGLQTTQKWFQEDRAPRGSAENTKYWNMTQTNYSCFRSG